EPLKAGAGVTGALQHHLFVLTPDVDQAKGGLNGIDLPERLALVGDQGRQHGLLDDNFEPVRWWRGGVSTRALEHHFVPEALSDPARDRGVIDRRQALLHARAGRCRTIKRPESAIATRAQNRSGGEQQRKSPQKTPAAHALSPTSLIRRHSQSSAAPRSPFSPVVRPAHAPPVQDPAQRLRSRPWWPCGQS